VKLTLDWLKEKSACIDGVVWFKAQKETDSIKVLNALIKEDKLDWASWLIVRLMTYKQQIQYAAPAAEQVIGLFEELYPDSNKENRAVAYATANTVMRKKMLNYGIELLSE